MPTFKYNADGSSSVGFGGLVTVTRPANATPYTAGDVLGGAITFPSMGSAGGATKLTSADIRIHIAAIPAGMTSFRLHLYNATPPSATADNGVWDLPAGDRASYLGFIDLGTPADVGATLFAQLANADRQVNLAAGVSSLYGYLVTNGAFTPAGNSEVYVVGLYSLAL